MKRFATPQELLAYTGLLLDQMAALVAGHDADLDGDFAEFLGPHMRHIIEHYETLTGQLSPAGRPGAAVVLDYDARVRDVRVQSDPAFALARLSQLRVALEPLAAWPVDAFDQPLELHAQGGGQGEFYMASRSSWLRELMFLASHCVHHFAVIKLHALQHGKDLGAHFGKAPATVAHESAPNMQ